MRWCCIVPVVVACGSPAALTPRPPPPMPPPPVIAATPEAAPVEPPPPPKRRTVFVSRPGSLLQPIERTVDDQIPLEGRWRNGALVMRDVAEIDFLSPCVRDFVKAQPEAARKTLITALTQYITTCDRDGRVVLDRPLGFDSRERRSRSDATFAGTLSAQRLDLVLRIAYCGGESAAPDHVTVIADDATWTSSRLEFQRDAIGCDVAELPYTRALGRILLRATDADTAAIRFEGTNARELALGDDIQHELRVVLDAVEVLAQ